MKVVMKRMCEFRIERTKGKIYNKKKEHDSINKNKKCIHRKNDEIDSN